MPPPCYVTSTPLIARLFAQSGTRSSPGQENQHGQGAQSAVPPPGPLPSFTADATPASAARHVSRVLPRVRHGVDERQPHPDPPARPPRLPLPAPPDRTAPPSVIPLPYGRRLPLHPRTRHFFARYHDHAIHAPPPAEHRVSRVRRALRLPRPPRAASPASTARRVSRVHCAPRLPRHRAPRLTRLAPRPSRGG